MKRLINLIDQTIYRFKKLNKLIDSKTTTSSVVKSVLSALLITVIILAIPVLIVVNMFIISKLTFILAILLVVIVVSWPYLYYAFYYKILKNYHEEIKDINTKLPYLIESSIIAIVLLTVGIIVLSIIF
jgi:c-di-AMP phosphodiesterase-like protein